MAAPNLIGASLILGKTTAVALSNTSAFSVLNNGSSSGKCFKVNTLNVANPNTSVAANISINYYTTANLVGTAFPIVGNITVPAGSTLNVIDKGSPYYMEENTSIGAFASTGGVLFITTSYEDIS
jgi:hypothetical protein